MVDLLLKSRTPQAAAADQLVTVGHLSFDQFRLDGRLNDTGSGRIDAQISAMTEAVRDQLRDPRATPSEIWGYDGQTLVWAGPLLGWQHRAGVLHIAVATLEHYLDGMFVPQDVVRTATDETIIARDLVNLHQGVSYGHRGIDTSGLAAAPIGLAGDLQVTPGDLEYVGDILRDRAEAGFDFWVDPATRALHVEVARGTDHRPTLGVLSDDKIVEDNWAYDTGDVASDVWVRGERSDDGDPETDDPYLLAQATDNPTRAAFGFRAHAEALGDLRTAGAVTAAAPAILESMAKAGHQPFITLRVDQVISIGTFAPGDTVAIDYDFGLGRIVTAGDRLERVRVRAEDDGQFLVDLATLSVDV